MTDVGYFKEPKGMKKPEVQNRGYGLIKRLQDKDTERNFLFSAIEQLKEPEEMKQFYREYVEYLKAEGETKDTKENAERVARENIGYALGYYEKETGKKWLDALPEVYHPFFGRNIYEVTGDEAFRKGFELGTEMKNKAQNRDIREKYGDKHTNAEKLYGILEQTTQVFRKGNKIQKNKKGNLEVVEVYDYPHTNISPRDLKYEKVDMIFIDVLVDREKARQFRHELEDILADYPDRERLAGGPSYIELAPNLNVEQEAALRTMALGKVLGLWDVMSGKKLGLDDEETRKLAGNGFLTISGYKPGGKK